MIYIYIYISATKKVLLDLQLFKISLLNGKRASWILQIKVSHVLKEKIK